MKTRTTSYLVLSLVVGFGLAGCTANRDGSQPQPPASATSSMSSDAVGTPEAIPNLRILDQQPATSGSRAAGSFFAHKGELWINFNCLGAGTAKVIYSPVGSMDVPCVAAALNATKNTIYFPDDRQVSLRVEAPASVQWAVLVQQ